MELQNLGHTVTEKLKLICVGAIAGAFGVKGEVRLKAFTSNPTDIVNYAPLLTEGEDKSFDVVITGQLKMASLSVCRVFLIKRTQIS